MMKKLMVLLAICMCQSIAASFITAVNNDFDNILNSALKGSLIVVRQDYQLVNDDEGEIKNAPDKEYWNCGYSLAIRVGDDNFLISGDALRPWIREKFSRNDPFQPAISHSSIRQIDAPEFEHLDFDPEDVTEITESRLYTTGGSEEQGLSLVGFTGQLNGYAVWVTPISPLVDGNDGQSLNVEFSPMSINISSSKNLYDITKAPGDTPLGGFFLIPVVRRPGIVDFCVAGQFQKVGGVWKLISVSEGADIQASY